MNINIFTKNLLSFLTVITFLLCTTIQPVMVMAFGSCPVPLRKGEHALWLYRLNLNDAIDRSRQNYAENLYRTLSKAVDPKYQEPCLIDPTLASHHVEDQADADYYYVLVASFDNSSKSLKNDLDNATTLIEAVCNAFMCDYTHIFWLNRDGFKIRYVENPSTKSIDLHLILAENKPLEEGQPLFDIRQEYYRSPEKIKAAIAEGTSCIKAIISPLKKSRRRHKKVYKKGARYAQVKYLNRWLTQNNSTFSGDMETVPDDTPYSPHECLCALKGNNGDASPSAEGYARAFQLLCRVLKIPCVITTGSIDNGGSSVHHMWNLVQMDDEKWYAVDVTSNGLAFEKVYDPVLRDEHDGNEYDENETYLLVGTQTMCRDGIYFSDSHQISNRLGSTAFTNGPQLSRDKYKPAT